MTDGHIILESAVVQVDVTVRYGDDAVDSSEHMGLFNLTHNGMATCMTADLPLVECLA